VLIDSSKLHTQGLSDLLQKYEEARAWLESHGVRVNLTRFQKYKEQLARPLQVTQSSQDISADLGLLWAHAELHDLLEIYTCLKDIRDSKFVENLKKIATGPTLLDDEKSDGGNIHGRSFTFELYTAARLVRAGYPVSFKSLADTNFMIDNTLIHVECKRAVSENNVDQLIHRANEQIAERCREYPNINQRGIVAVSITRLVWKAFEQNAKGVHADVGELRLIMIAMLNKWAPLIIGRFKRYAPTTIAILLHYKMPFRRQTDGAVAFLNRFSSYPLYESADIEGKMLLASLNERFHSSTNPDP